MLFVQNASYYIAHIAVANDARGANMARDIALAAETYAVEEHPASIRGKRDTCPDTTRKPPTGPLKDGELRCADSSHRPNIFRRYRNVAFPLGSCLWGVFRRNMAIPLARISTPALEAGKPISYSARTTQPGPKQISHECPSTPGSSKLAYDFRKLWSRAFYFRRASGTYAHVGGRNVAINKKPESAIDTPLNFMRPNYANLPNAQPVARIRNYLLGLGPNRLFVPKSQARPTRAIVLFNNMEPVWKHTSNSSEIRRSIRVHGNEFRTKRPTGIRIRMRKYLSGAMEAT